MSVASPFYRVMRWLERVNTDKPPIGQALHPADEAFQLGAAISNAFRANECQVLNPSAFGKLECDLILVQKTQLWVNFMSLLGPMGPLPAYLTEEMIQFQRDDPEKTNALIDFLRLFEHGVLRLYYRIWAQTQPTVQHHYREQDRLALMISRLGGHMNISREHFLPLNPTAVVSKSVHQLKAWVLQRWALTLSVVEHVAEWVRVSTTELTQLGQCNTLLGWSAWIGQRIFSQQHKVRFCIDEMSLSQFSTLLPGTSAGKDLAQGLDRAIPTTMDWELELQLASDQLVMSPLGQVALGRTAWVSSMPGKLQRRVVFSSSAYLGVCYD